MRPREIRCHGHGHGQLGGVATFVEQSNRMDWRCRKIWGPTRSAGVCGGKDRQSDWPLQQRHQTKRKEKKRKAGWASPLVGCRGACWPPRKGHQRGAGSGALEAPCSQSAPSGRCNAAMQQALALKNREKLWTPSFHPSILRWTRSARGHLGGGCDGRAHAHAHAHAPGGCGRMAV